MRANKIVTLSIILIQIIFISFLEGSEPRSIIDVGSPMVEAMYNLVLKKYVLVSTPLNKVDGLERVDCFMWNKEKILYIRSKASRHGGFYHIIQLSQFELGKIKTISIKDLKFFSNFDLGKCEGYNQ